MAFFSNKDNKVTKTVENTVAVTVVAADTSMEGKIESSGIIRIEGEYKGEIHSTADVIIEEGGYVKGDINATNISISGRMEGSMKCYELLEIQSSGILIGNIEVKSMFIEEGAIFRGKSTMLGEVEENLDLIDATEIDVKKYYLEESYQK